LGLFVDTTGSDVVISELGITIVDPATDFDLSGQFDVDDIRKASTLTTNIRDGTLAWKKTSGGTIETPADYDAEFLQIEEERTGPGLQDDRSPTFSDITDELVKVTGSDTTSGNLSSKIIAGTGITLTTLNPAANEQLEITSVVPPGASLVALFGATSNNINNRFLESESIGTSDDIPGVIPIDVTITKITFTNANTAPTGTIEIRVNTTVGAPAISAVITTSTQTQVFTISLALLAGDEVNCFVSAASGVGKPLVKVYV